MNEVFRQTWGYQILGINNVWPRLSGRLYSLQNKPRSARCVGHDQGFSNESFLAKRNIAARRKGKQMGVSINGDPQKCLIYKGKSHENGWFGGTPISGNHQINSKLREGEGLEFNLIQTQIDTYAILCLYPTHLSDKLVALPDCKATCAKPRPEPNGEPGPNCAPWTEESWWNSFSFFCNCLHVMSCSEIEQVDAISTVLTVFIYIYICRYIDYNYRQTIDICIWTDPQGGLHQKSWDVPLWWISGDRWSGTGQERVLRPGGHLGPWLARRCSAWSGWSSH